MIDDLATQNLAHLIDGRVVALLRQHSTFFEKLLVVLRREEIVTEAQQQTKFHDWQETNLSKK